MKRIMALTLALLVWALSAQALTVEDFADLEAPVAGLLSNLIDGGLAYPADGGEITDESARAYLFYMANIFYTDEPAHPEGANGNFDAYLAVPQDEAALLLEWAFGGLYDIADFAPDGDTVLLKDGVYYVGMSDGYALKATYAGEENPAFDTQAEYPFDFSLDYGDGGRRTGRAWVMIDETGDPAAPFCVTNLRREFGEGDIFGNWQADDGYWFSLMEEGLCFFFNDRFEMIEEGGFVFDEGIFSFTLKNGDIEAPLESEGVTMTIDGAAHTYRIAPNAC